MSVEIAELHKLINEHYGLAVGDLKPKGQVYTFTSPSGYYLLKRVPLEPASILRLHQNLSQLQKSGFQNLATFMTTTAGLPYFSYHMKNFIIMPWYHGEHPSFHNHEHLKTLGTLYGRLHQAALTLQKKSVPVEILVSDLQEKTAFLAAMPSCFKSNKANRVDRKIREMLPYFQQQAIFCCNGLNAICSQLKNPPLPAGFCHNDPAPRNIIVDKGSWILIDFDLSGSGPLISELTNLLQRVLRSNDWSPSVADLVYRAYLRERALTDLEVRLIPYIWFFPRSFWRICRQRFIEQLKWGERRFASRLWQINAEEGLRTRFLNNWFAIGTGGLND